MLARAAEISDTHFMNSSDETQAIPELDAPHLPRLTRRLFGHHQAVQSVAQVAKSGRMPHGWLLTGPRGVGKASFAYLMARAILGNHNLAGLATATLDETSHLIEIDAHSDLFTLRRKFNTKTDKFQNVIPVEDVRALREAFTFTTARGGWRVCIIDALDDMNHNGANALLKILEEPPPKSLLLIICHNSGMVLDTVRSRCQHLPFNELQADELAELLANLYPTAKPDEREMAANLAQGSAGMAVRLMDADGLVIYRELIAVLSQLPQADNDAVHALAAHFTNQAKDKDRFLLFAFLLQGWLYRLVRSKSRGAAIMPIFAEEGALATRFVRNLTLEALVGLWEKIGEDVAIVEEYNLDRKNRVISWLEMVGEALNLKSVA